MAFVGFFHVCLATDGFLGLSFTHARLSVSPNLPLEGPREKRIRIESGVERERGFLRSRGRRSGKRVFITFKMTQYVGGSAALVKM